MNLGSPSYNMFLKRNKKESIEPKEQKPKKDRWWVACSFYEDIEEKEIMKKNVDYKHSKLKF